MRYVQRTYTVYNDYMKYKMLFIFCYIGIVYTDKILNVVYKIQ